MEKIYLTVPFRDKDAAKGLGARFDGETKRWYVTEGTDLTPFAAWCERAGSVPERVNRVSVAANSVPTDAPPPAESVGIPLSSYLGAVAQVVRAACTEPTWVVGEISEVRLRNGHLYLTLVETDATGQAKAKLVCNAFSAERRTWWRQFVETVGGPPEVGMKLLLQIAAKLDPLYGFSAEIHNVNAEFVLGEMAAKLKRVVSQLDREGLLNRNHQHPKPVDFTSIAVVAPEGAAGLGDFMREAGELQSAGLLKIQHFPATFQGASAADSVTEALRTAAVAHATTPFDAIIVIRGGGASLDLDWLNVYAIGRAIAEAPVPVMVGIGHERDRTLPDHVAAMSFDTPSKVSAWIRETIIGRCKQMVQWMDTVQRLVSARVERAEHALDQALLRVQRSTENRMSRASAALQQIAGGLVTRTQHRLERADATIGQILRQCERGVATRLDRAPQLVDQLRQSAQHRLADRLNKGDAALAILQSKAEALDPGRVLRRGFALVMGSNGRVVSSVSQATGAVSIRFADGMAKAFVENSRDDVGNLPISNRE